MVQHCALKTCQVEWNPLLEVGFHSFPVANEELLAKWIESIPKDLLPKWTRNTCICSKHFEENCYESGCGVRKKLKKNAVPTIFKCSNEHKDDTNNSISKTNSSTLQQLADSRHFILNLNDATYVNCHRNIPDLRTVRKIDVAVQVEHRYLPVSPETIKLKKEIKMLQQRLRRKNEALTALKLLCSTDHFIGYRESEDKIKEPLNTRTDYEYGHKYNS